MMNVYVCVCCACCMQWQVCIWRAQWEQSWLKYMYAVVAVGSVLIAGLLCSVLIMA